MTLPVTPFPRDANPLNSVLKTETLYGGLVVRSLDPIENSPANWYLRGASVVLDIDDELARLGGFVGGEGVRPRGHLEGAVANSDCLGVSVKVHDGSVVGAAGARRVRFADDEEVGIDGRAPGARLDRGESVFLGFEGESRGESRKEKGNGGQTHVGRGGGLLDVFWLGKCW